MYNKDDRLQSTCYTIVGLALLGGFIMSVISWLRICSGACEETHNYLFFGFTFEPLGFIFFPCAGLLHAFSRRHPPLAYFVGGMLSSALGAEFIFVGLQKFVIGHWCPVCLSIATCVLIGTAFFFLAYVESAREQINQHKKGILMKNLCYGLSCLSIFAMTFFLAFVGVAKPDTSFAAGIDNASPTFGNTQSNVEVYVITDWFCPACRAIESKMEKMYPAIMKKATLIFIDRDIHPATMNYAPYNIAFMIREKGKYFAIRKALHKLAEKTKTPTDADIQAAVAPLGVKYQSIPFAEVESGIKFFEGVARTFKIDSTPTIVVSNRNQLNARMLVGGKEITEERVLALINELSK